jgi:hypothetical protein
MKLTLETAFILGLVGSVHCAGMCGPLALALPVPPGSRGHFVLGRVVYHAGRVVTYCWLGLVFGLVGRTLLLAGFQRWVSILLGVALLVGLLGSRYLARALPMTRWVAHLQGSMGGWLRQRTLLSLGVLGLLTGLLPCGLVYVACVGATATGSLIAGMQYMAVFGLGTIPLMLAISLSGKLVRPSWRAALVRLVPLSVFLLACLLILRGMSLGIPYVSPDLSGAAGSCCHGAASAPE